MKELSRELLEDGTVKVINETILPRYRVGARADQYYCEEVCNIITDDCKIWVKSRNYSNLNSIHEDLSEIFVGKTLEDDLEIFQKYLDDNFGKDKYEAFVLGAYIHGGTSFSVNKTGNHVCQWDSSQLGFIGIPTDEEHNYTAKNAGKVALDLNAAWNGEFVEYIVYDNLTDKIEFSIVTSDYQEIKKYNESCKEQYGVDFSNVNIEY